MILTPCSSLWRRTRKGTSNGRTHRGADALDLERKKAAHHGQRRRPSLDQRWSLLFCKCLAYRAHQFLLPCLLGGLVFPESVVPTNTKTPTQAVAPEGRWPTPVRTATCQVNPSRTLRSNVRSSEQPQRLGLLLVRLSLGGWSWRLPPAHAGSGAWPGERVSRGPGTWVRPPTWLSPFRSPPGPPAPARPGPGHRRTRCTVRSEGCCTAMVARSPLMDTTIFSSSGGAAWPLASSGPSESCSVSPPGPRLRQPGQPHRPRHRRTGRPRRSGLPSGIFSFRFVRHGSSFP